MRGVKAKKIRKIQFQCAHRVDVSLKRDSPYTVHLMRCVDCGFKINQLRPMSEEAKAILAADLKSGKAREKKA